MINLTSVLDNRTSFEMLYDKSFILHDLREHIFL